MTAEGPAVRAATAPAGAKTYRGRTMREALARVRRDLGGDALILAAREVRRRRMFGMGPGATVEVEASPEATPGGPAHVSAMLDVPGRADRWSPRSTAGLAAAYARLLEVDAPESFARVLVREAARASADDPTAEPGVADVRGVLEDALAVGPPIRAVPGTRRVVALVGPTGVGKTTTLAKLAATLKLRRGVKVALLAADAHRIAAAEQLRTYAEILDVPVATGDDPDAARRALDGLGAAEVVLVDTAGLSPRDGRGLGELGDLLARIRPDEVHLALAATTSTRGLRAAADAFAAAGPDRLILTKLDEAETLGPLLAVLGRADRPVSYLATGRAVPDGLEAASRGRLARLILGEEGVS